MSVQIPEKVFPAHAGMSLIEWYPGGIKDGFPRSRGDEPSWAVRTRNAIGFSPLTRG